MSIYTNTLHVCSCNTSKLKPLDPSSPDVRENLFIQNPSSFPLQNLADLYICSDCHILKCKQCLISKIESKFCPSCLTDHTKLPNEPLYCSKNCFNCPKCSSHLIITSKTMEARSKQFKFSCTYCDYSYTTGIIDKPRSLQSIVKSEIEVTPFKDFQKKFTSIVQLNKPITERQTSKKITPELLEKLNSLNLSNLTKRLTTTDDLISKSEKLENQINSINSIKIEESSPAIDEIANLSDMISIHQQSKNHTSQVSPNPTLLITKRSLYCSTCSSTVLMPEPSPILLKFPIKWNAIDILPTIKVYLDQNSVQFYLGASNTCSINFMNSSSQPCLIKISTVALVPLQFFKTSFSPKSIDVTLPTLSTIRLGGRGDSKKEAIIKSIPTDYLTKNTQQSRTELMLRQGMQLLLKSASTNPNVSIDDSFDESFDTSIIMDTLETWALIKMKFTITGNGELNLKIPLHLSIDTHLNGKQFKYKYWVIANLGTFNVTDP